MKKAGNVRGEAIRGVVLAGGKARRMGIDKKQLRILGRSLLDWIFENLAQSNIPLSMLSKDLVPGLGPLGGMRTACARYDERWLLFLSCDMPFVNTEILSPIIQKACVSNASVLAEVEGRSGFPFLLDANQITIMARQLRHNRRSLHGFARSIACAKVSFEAKIAWRFTNINTPEDLQKARNLAIQMKRENLP